MDQTVKLYLIRHGRPTGGFADVVDPGLDEVGAAQAEAVARELGSHGPLPIVSSPLQRAQETAAPLARLWQSQVRIEPAVAEIPTPQMDLQARATWVRTAMRGRWSELGEVHQQWRERLVATLVGLGTSTVVTTHFIAINAAVGAATGDDRMVCCEPDHCSCTILEIRDSRLHLVSLGRQRETQIL
jgi:broad specificity phosphatase PhoE